MCGAAHLYDFPVYFERRHDLVKQLRAQFGFHVFDDVFHPRAWAAVVGVNHDPAALVGLVFQFQKPQQVQNIRSQEFGECIHQTVEVRVLSRRVVVPRRCGESIAKNAQFHKVSDGFIHVKHHYFFIGDDDGSRSG